MQTQIMRILSLATTLGLLLAVVPVDTATRTAAANHAPDELFVLFADDTITAEEFSALARAGVDAVDVSVKRANAAVLKLGSDDDAPAVLKEVRALDDVTAVAPIRSVVGLGFSPPNDTRYIWRAPDPFFVDQQTTLGPNETDPHSIDLEPVWRATLSGGPYSVNPYRRGITTAILDSGATLALVEDSSLLSPVWNYVSGTSNTADDSGGANHGTRVASLIAANTDNGAGIAGAMHTASGRVLVYKVLNAQLAGQTDHVMTAMMDAADRGAKVIHLSLGHRATLADDTSMAPDSEVRQMWEQVVAYCRGKGALVVAASGNGGGSTYTDVYYPAACEGAIAVGSIDPLTGARSTFSSYGPRLDVVAPGERVWTLRSNGTSENHLSGTSFAAPLVTGAISYLWSLVPSLPADEMFDMVRSGAVGAGYGPDPGFDDATGYGRFDADAILSAMISAVPVQPTPSLSSGEPEGIETSMSWTPAAGTNVFYRYGYEGGPEYQTTATSARIALPGSGEHTAYVRAYATDLWSAALPATRTVTVQGSVPGFTSQRYEGADRYLTSAAISRATAPTTADTVVIASGENWPDGLAASSLAGALGAPLLLTPKSRVALTVRDEIWRLKPTRIYIVGGAGAVSSAIETKLRTLPLAFTITRLAGSDRYDTARLVALKTREVAGPVPEQTAIVVSGENYPDALAASPLSAFAGFPILLTRRNAMPAATAAAIDELGIAATVLVGGAGVVSDGVMARLPGPVRIAGKDRYETSRRFAVFTVNKGWLEYERLGVATGLAFPDALAAGPLLGTSRSPLVLADAASQGLNSWLLDVGAGVDELRILGGPGAVSYDLETSIKSHIRAQ